MQGFKLLICGLPNSGKSFTLLRKSSLPLNDTLIIHIDDKEITNPNLAWVNIVSLISLQEDADPLKNQIQKIVTKIPKNTKADKNIYFDGRMKLLFEKIYKKISIYKSKKGKLPKYIIFDTVSKLFGDTAQLYKLKAKGYDVWNYIDGQMSVFNYYIAQLTGYKFNIILISHTYEENNYQRLPASGDFKKYGGFFGQVGASLYFHKQEKVYVKSSLYRDVCRFDYDIDISDEYIIDEDFDLYKELILPIEEFKREIGDNQL
jgi:hypothetical protein